MNLGHFTKLCSLMNLDLEDISLDPKLAVALMSSLEIALLEKDRAVEQVNPTAQSTNRRRLYSVPSFDVLPF